MSFHKLKIGSRKKDSSSGSKPLIASQQKVKQRNQQLMMNLNTEGKLHSRKANIISMSDDFHHDIFKLKKPQFNVAPKTQRLHKIEKIDFPVSTRIQNSDKNSNQKSYHFNYSNSQQNQEYSAVQLLDFLSAKPNQQSKQGESFSTRFNKIFTFKNSEKSQSKTSNQQKQQFKSTKQVQPNEQNETKERPKTQLRRKTIELDQQPLNCQNNASSNEVNYNFNQVTIKQIQKQKQKFLKTQKIEKDQICRITENQQDINIVEKLKTDISETQEIEKSTLIQKQIKQEAQKTANSQIHEPQNKEVSQPQEVKSQILEVKQVSIKKQVIKQVIKQNIISQSQKVTQKQLLIEQTEVKHENEETKTKLQPQRIQIVQEEPQICQVKQNLILVETPQRKKKDFPPRQNSKSKSSGKKSSVKQSFSPISESNYLAQSQVTISPSKLSYRPINEVEVTILQQNRSLIQQVQKLRKERDQLAFNTKRLQIQLLQSNCKQYYEKEINRLKAQVQTLQYASEQLKHNNFILQNKNNELQSSSQLQKKQIKKLLKQLQTTKIQSTKQKYQLKQKSSTLQTLIKQLQDRNNQMGQKFEEYYKKSNQLQKNVKAKSQENIELRKNITILQARLGNIERSSNEKIKHYESQIQNNTAQKSTMQLQFRQYRRQLQSQLQALRQSIKQMNLKRQSQTLLISSRIKSLEKHNNTIQAELQVVRLQETVKELQSQIHKRSQLIRQLNTRIDSMISMQDYQQLRRQLQSLSSARSQQKQQYEKQILTLTKQIEIIRNKLQHNQKILQQQQVLTEKSPNNNNKSELYQKENFKQILKQQILQCDNLKQEVFNKTQALYKVKEQHEQLKIKYQSLRNDQQIMKKQFASFENNSKIKKEILQQQLANEIQSLKRKHTLVQKKLQSKIKQNKEKQSFIQTYIIGNSQNKDSAYLIKQLERIFLEKQKIENSVAV